MTLPAHILTLGQVVRHQAEQRPDAIAFTFEGRVSTFGDFDQGVSRVANALLADGLEKGDRIAWLGKNSDDYFEAWLGATRAGVVMSPVNWRLALPEILYILGDSNSRILFLGREFEGMAGEIRAGLPDLKIILVEPSSGEPGYPAWRDAQPATDPDVEIGVGEVCIQLYTSGTTGRPKGAQLSHGNLILPRLAQAKADSDWNRWTADDVSLVAMPISHIGGSGWGVTGLYNGAKGVVAREFDPNKVLDFLEHDKVSKIFMVPAAMQIVVRHPRARAVDYSAMKYILYGASPIPLDLLRECMEVFGCGFVQMYGMTETTGTVVALGPEDHDPNGTPRMRSAGKPLPGVEIRIIDEDGQTVGPNVVGEIATRSAANMVGYWNLTEATAATISEDGWLRSGDAGYLDEDGYLYIHDRVKDMIVSGGENVYPAEVENAVFGCPGVAEVAVIGIPDARWGEAVKAVVVKREGADLTEADVIAWARKQIAGYKIPKSVDFIAAIPRNASGKILRRELREPYWKGVDRRVN